MSKDIEIIYRIIAYDKTDEIFGLARYRLKQIVSKTVLDLQRETQLRIRANDLIDTGFLLNSVTSSMQLHGLQGEVIVGATYGFWHEFGTTKIHPRPFFLP